MISFNQASQRILLVTFAAHRIERLCGCLHGALSRRVSLTLVLEAEQESEGQLSQRTICLFLHLGCWLQDILLAYRREDTQRRW